MTYSVVLMGTPAFAVPILEALIKNNDYDVKAVVTQPDRPQGRKHTLTPSPVKTAAQIYGITVLQPEKISGSPEMQEIIDINPDFIVTAAFGQFLPTKLLNAAKIAAVNTHASLLPKYRGGAPVHYAIMNGDKETGVSIMYMVKTMDAGDVIDTVKIPITDQDNVGTMFEKLSIAGRDLLLETLPKIATGDISPVAQDKEKITFSPNIPHEMQNLNFATETAKQLDWHIRGLYPTHPAFAQVLNQRMKITDVTPLLDETNQTPGSIVERNKKQLKIAAADGTVVQINRLQPAGKSEMAISAYLNGAGKDLEVGQKWAIINE
ncbi:methionyl-tRNA formyltransferase [Leuconostoc litchii]|uniref:Methionyl-tRNA formyltransferase n=1 Tax=Leuconostoc litchii TaxID=1981069 RepID=A0A6P2CL21_9LACO|nr:methionyl-tRNA formyltransferase [Leuconostoc litchii]TYC46576.1 methionyl-tRNA formyltransferase [Leuconostoc litchii]GMA70429.1 methionyl-tRNA formyltransferase [Leuconostoc litchii]